MTDHAGDAAVAGRIRAETMPGLYVDGIDIAPNGAVWVHGEQTARLPDGALP